MTSLIRFLPGDLILLPDPLDPVEKVLGMVVDIVVYHFKKEPEYVVITDHNYSFNKLSERYAFRFNVNDLNLLGILVERLIETPFNSICRENICILKDIYKGCPEGCIFENLTAENNVYLPLDIVREITTGSMYKVIGIGLSIWSGDLGEDYGYYESYKPVSPWSIESSDRLLNCLDSYLSGSHEITGMYTSVDIDIQKIWNYLKEDKTRSKLNYNLCSSKLTYLASNSKTTWVPQNRLRLWKRSSDVYTFFRAGTMSEICKKCIFEDTEKCNTCKTKKLYGQERTD